MSQYPQQPGPYGGPPPVGPARPPGWAGGAPATGGYAPHPVGAPGRPGPSAPPTGPAPQGYPQAPYPGAVPPPIPPRRRRINPLLWVGLGCVVLLLGLLLLLGLVVQSNAPKKGTIGHDITMGSSVASVDAVDCSKSSVKGLVNTVYTAKRGHYCAVQVTVTNHASTALTMSGGNQTLVVGSDEYPDDPEVTSFLILDDAMDYVSIAPGDTQTMVVVFDSPSASPDALKLQVGTGDRATKATVALHA